MVLASTVLRARLVERPVTSSTTMQAESVQARFEGEVAVRCRGTKFPNW